MKMGSNKECIGECPVCFNSNLDYDNSKSIDDGRIYPFTCLICGCEGQEIYSEVYATTEYDKPVSALLLAAEEILSDFNQWGEVLQLGDNGEYGMDSAIGRLNSAVIKEREKLTKDK